MAIINQATKELIIKIVYYGPPSAGKTTNLVQLHEHAHGEKGRLMSLATSSDRTLYFDIRAAEDTTIRGFTPVFQIFTGRVKSFTTLLASSRFVALMASCLSLTHSTIE